MAGFASLGHGLFVDPVELITIDLFTGQQNRIARIDDVDFLQHLANDHFDVFVVDLHALEPIDILDLLH